MARYRAALPQLADSVFLTDGGLETDLIFHHGIELPAFASFVLLDTEDGREALRGYYRPYLELARQYGTGFVLEAPTWRANRDWGHEIGYSALRLAHINRRAVAFMEELRGEFDDAVADVVISGCIGPRGDGYVPEATMNADEAEAYHREQIEVLAATEVDMVAALTMNYIEEAIGIARAAAVVQLPSALSFTVETDGRLPSGETLQAAVERVDAATGGTPAYYMINCAHPSHFAEVLGGQAWTRRIRGIRANASICSHAELDGAPELDEGDPAALAAAYVDLRDRLDELTVLGGCCGTDVRHVAAICRAVVAPAWGSAF